MSTRRSIRAQGREVASLVFNGKPWGEKSMQRPAGEPTASHPHGDTEHPAFPNPGDSP